MSVEINEICQKHQPMTHYFVVGCGTSEIISGDTVDCRLHMAKCKVQFCSIL